MVTPIDEDHALWERREDEPPEQHAAFRYFRDLPPSQRSIAAVVEHTDVSERSVRRWAEAWDWRDRAAAWDDACHRTEDQERLEAIRSMHSTHRTAGRVAVVKALQALQTVDSTTMPPMAIARLLELGARLERQTLIVSIEELQGVEVEYDDDDDPWERIARELDPSADE